MRLTASDPCRCNGSAQQSAAPGVNASVLYPLNAPNATAGTISQSVTLVNGTGGFSIAQQIQQIRSGLWYVNIHTSAKPAGEIRGQVVPPPSLTCAVVAYCLPLGCHTVTLEVSDGTDRKDCSVDVCVISASE